MLRQIVVVGGGSRNDFLCQLTAERTGRTVTRGSAESSIIGNFAVQLAALEGNLSGSDERFAVAVSAWSSLLAKAMMADGAAIVATPRDGMQCIDATF
jgi:rhamnulokinase